MTAGGIVDGLWTSGEREAGKVAPKLKLAELTAVTCKGARYVWDGVRPFKVP